MLGFIVHIKFRNFLDEFLIDTTSIVPIKNDWFIYVEITKLNLELRMIVLHQLFKFISFISEMTFTGTKFVHFLKIKINAGSVLSNCKDVS